MRLLERRSILKGGAAATAALCLPGELGAAGTRAGVFVVDRRFAVSEAVARDRRERGALVVDPRQEDLGVSWRGRIPEWLGDNEASVEGVTLWSDFVICQTFARSCGLRLVGAPQPAASAAEQGLHRWLLARARADGGVGAYLV